MEASAKTTNTTASGLRPAVDRIAASAHEAVDRVAGVATAAAHAVEKKGEVLKGIPQQYLEDCRECVRDNPLASVAVALAAGYLLSLVLRLR